MLRAFRKFVGKSLGDSSTHPLLKHFCQNSDVDVKGNMYRCTLRGTRMAKSKWNVYAFGILLLIGPLSMELAGAADPCGDNTDAGPADVKSLSEITKALHQNAKPNACLSLDHSKPIPVGTLCTTSRGSIWTRVSRKKFGEAWKGPDGFIWSDRLGFDNHYNAVNTCEDVGGHLPSKEIFRHGEADDIREVLPNMKSWYWTKSTKEDAVYSFNGDDGSTELFTRLDINRMFVRCVGR